MAPTAPAPRFRDVTVLLGDPTLPDPSKPEGRYHEEDLVCVDRLREALGTLEAGGDAGGGYRFEYRDRHEGLIAALVGSPPAFVLNFCDVGYRNRARFELHVPALLELLDVPYTGSDPACITLCTDKAVVRAVAASLGIAVPDERFVPAGAVRTARPARYPTLIKPNRADGSLGLTADAVVHDADAAGRYLERLAEWLPGHDVLFQEYLTGPEYGVGVIGNPAPGDPDGGLRILPVLEVDYGGLAPELPPILGYESKSLPDSPYWTDIRFREAKLPAATRDRLAETARRLVARLGLRDYARFDLRADADGVIKLLEVNPNPAWAHDAKLAMMAGFAGLSHGEMLRLVLEAAERRLSRPPAA